MHGILIYNTRVLLTVKSWWG